MFVRWIAGETGSDRLTASDERRTVHVLLVGLRGVGNLLIGRPAPELENEMRDPPAPVSVETLIACLKRLEKSVKLWNEQGGRQGYLEYIAEFLP